MKFTKYFCIGIFTLIISNPVIIISQENKFLKEVFKDHFMIGAAINTNQFSGKDEIGIKLIKNHFNTVTAENVLKWERIQPKENEYSFNHADQFVNFAEENDMFIVGHTLVWHSQTPGWVFKDGEKQASRELLLKRMKDHIFTVVQRYKGRIHAWDVVNEALNEDGTLRQSPWLKIIGEDYIEKAFQFAHEADPEAELYYNDYSLENKPKREGAIKLVKNLQAKGIHISGIGSQLHAKLYWPSPSQLDSTINEFSDLGIKVMFTEVDIDVLPEPNRNQTAEVSLKFEAKEELNPFKKGLPDSVEQLLTKKYEDFFKVFLKNSDKIDRVTFWGVKDSDSWLNNWPIYGRTNFPLIFDRNGNTKPAFEKIIKVGEKNL